MSINAISRMFAYYDISIMGTLEFMSLNAQTYTVYLNKPSYIATLLYKTMVVVQYFTNAPGQALEFHFLVEYLKLR